MWGEGGGGVGEGGGRERGRGRGRGGVSFFRREEEGGVLGSLGRFFFWGEGEEGVFFVFCLCVCGGREEGLGRREEGGEEGEGRRGGSGGSEEGEGVGREWGEVEERGFGGVFFLVRRRERGGRGFGVFWRVWEVFFGWREERG